MLEVSSTATNWIKSYNIIFRIHVNYATSLYLKYINQFFYVFNSRLQLSCVDDARIAGASVRSAKFLFLFVFLFWPCAIDKLSRVGFWACVKYLHIMWPVTVQWFGRVKGGRESVGGNADWYTAASRTSTIESDQQLHASAVLERCCSKSARGMTTVIQVSE